MMKLQSLLLFIALLQVAVSFMIWPTNKTRRNFISVCSVIMNIAKSESIQKNKKSIQLGFVGDVMIGRGIDAILPFSVDSTIHESFMKDANGYVRLAIKQNGPLPIPPEERKASYIWGDLVEELKLPDVLVINLETALTTSQDWMKYKGINYRSHPRNVNSLTEIGVDVATLANNHVLDWGEEGLKETIQTLKSAGIQYAGAGVNKKEASAMASIDIPSPSSSNGANSSANVTIAVLAIGFPSAGVPSSWQATSEKSGVNYARDTNEKAVQQIIDTLRQHDNEKGSPPDIVIASLHWGPNWGWGVPHEWRKFAHRLIDNGVDIIVGHSSHHVKGIEVYRGKMIAYGLGDFLNDYEGIVGQGYEDFRHDLSCLYRAKIDLDTKELLDIDIVPCKIQHLRVQRGTSEDDILWLKMALNKEGRSLGTRCETIKTSNGDTNLKLIWKY